MGMTLLALIVAAGSEVVKNNKHTINVLLKENKGIIDETLKKHKKNGWEKEK